LSRQQLGDVAIGDRITVTGADGSSRDYRVTGRKVVDPHLAEGDSVAPTGGTVSTITCWPLDAVTNSLRAKAVVSGDGSRCPIAACGACWTSLAVGQGQA
jgi:sortase (surface protein transpeptidase)